MSFLLHLLRVHQLPLYLNMSLHYLPLPLLILSIIISLNMAAVRMIQVLIEGGDLTGIVAIIIIMDMSITITIIIIISIDRDTNMATTITCIVWI